MEYVAAWACEEGRELSLLRGALGGAADICGFTHAFVHAGGRSCREQ
jgi:hypothetical protein